MIRIVVAFNNAERGGHVIMIMMNIMIIFYEHDHDDHNYYYADDNGVIRIVVPFNSRKQLGTCSRAGILELLSLNGTMMRMMMSMMTIIEWGKQQ